MKKQLNFEKKFEDVEIENLYVSVDSKSSDAPVVHIDDMINSIRGGAVCIACNTCSNLVERICNKLNNCETRQYIISSDKKSASKVVSGRYVRINKIKQNGMAIVHILNKNPKAWIFPNENSEFGYESTDAERLYLSFCNMFWSRNIVSEYRGNDDERTAQSPISQEFPMKDRLCMQGQISEKIRKMEKCDMYLSDNSSDIDFNQFSKLFAADSGNLSPVNKSSSEHIWLFEPTKENGFSLTSDGSDMYLLPSRIGEDEINWCEPINKKTYSDFEKSYKTTWELFKSYKIKNAVDKKIRYTNNVKEKIDILKTREISDRYLCRTVEDYLSDNKAIEDLYVSENKVTSPQSAVIQYHIEVYPPKLPSAAKKDELYSKWDSVKKDWNNALAALKSDANKYLGTTSNLGPAIYHAKTNGRDEIAQKADELSNINISIMSPAKRSRYIDEYEDLCNKTEEFRKSCDIEVKKNEFNKNKTSNIEKINALIKETTNKIDELNGKVSTLEKEVSKLKEKEKEDKENKKKIQGLQTMKDNLTKLKNTLDTKRAELKAEENSVFEYKENALHNSNKIVAKQFTFPSEELPVYESAILYNLSGKRYIAIPDSKNDSDLTSDILIGDARNLKATIVVRDNNE